VRPSNGVFTGNVFTVASHSNQSVVGRRAVTKARCTIVRENVRNTAKNVKSHDFLDFEKRKKT